MESKLKSLKVVELRDIIAKANVPCPPKAVKADLIASIIANPSAIQLYYQLHPPPQSADSASNQAPATRQVEQVPQKVVLSKASSPAPPPSTLDATKDSEAEKRTQRAARFGIPQVEKPPRKVTSKPPTSAPDDPEKLKARAARFGIPDALIGQKRPVPPEHVDAEEAERRRKRAERFGLTSVA